jgi:hypothetical protein
MIRDDNMALLSAQSANEIATLFNAFNSMVAINGVSVVHGEANLKLVAGEVGQAANPIPRVELIEPGSSDTYLSASKLNVLIAAYNKIMSSEGLENARFYITEGGIKVSVAT